MKKLIVFSFLLFGIIAFSQKKEQNFNNAIDSASVSGQFDAFYQNSGDWSEYKVVKKHWIPKLKSSVLDTVNKLKSELANTKSVLQDKEKQIVELTSVLNNTNENVAQLNKEKDGIKLFGAIISKSLYNTILWSIIIGLLVLLVLFIYKFNNSNTITKETQTKFDELDQEFEGYRHRSLEREQQLRRKLQDEINKQKG